MSHFTVLVIGDNPEEQLAPYDEQLETPEYDKGVVSKEDIKSCMDFYKDKKNGGYKLPFDELYEEKGDDWNSNQWRKNPDGTWHEYSSYNPNSKWDWYELGGRWSGELKLKTKQDGDQALKKDITNLNDISTFAVLKDGKWYEKGDMGWFGIVVNEMDEKEWDKQLKKLLKGLPGDTLISMYDCHI